MKGFTPLAAIFPLLIAAGCTEPQYSSLPPQVISSPPYGSATYAPYPVSADSDRALEAQIRQSLANGGLSYLVSHVSLTAANGTVTLAGSVPTAEDRQALDTLVRNTTGVNNVVNQLRIEPAVAESTPGVSTGPEVQTSTAEMDKSISDRIYQELRNNAATAALAQAINVSVQSGVVTLTGTVPSAAQRQAVDTVVRNQSGVRSVYDRLQLLPTGRSSQAARSYTSGTQSGAAPAESLATGDLFSLHVQGLNTTDRNLARQILEGLKTHTTLSTILPAVNINVSGGQVTLDGTVQTEQQKQTIGAAVQRAAGGNTVENRLEVQAQ